MNELMALRANLFYTKSKEGEEIKNVELVLLVDKPTYRRTNDDEIIRERGIKPLRMVVQSEMIKKLINQLERIKDLEEKDFH